MLRERLEKAIQTEKQSRIPKRWWASMIVNCPQKVLYLRRGKLEYEDNLSSWARKNLGSAIELVEGDLLEMAFSESNKTWKTELDKHIRLHSLVEDWKNPIMTDYVIDQLPFTIDLGLKDVVSCKADKIVLVDGDPVVIEIKSTNNITPNIYPAWVIQIGLYTWELGLPGLLHVWSRQTMELAEYEVYWKDLDLYIDGLKTRIDGLSILDFVKQRLRILEQCLDSGEDFHIINTEDHVRELILPDELPKHRFDQYKLVFNRNGVPAEQCSKNKVVYRSKNCFTCEAYNLCH